MNRSHQNPELESLYTNDKISWENETNARITQSKEERIEKIRARAHGLKAKREAERVEFAKDCYHRQWRESCDEMRVLQSKEMLNQIVIDRKLDTQKSATNNGDNDDEHSGDMCILQNEEGDEKLKRKHRESILETRRALDKQIELKQKQATASAAQLHREEHEQRLLLSKLEEEARDSDIRASEKAKQEQQEVFEDTVQRTKEKLNRLELEKHQDAILLQHALALEREVIQTENAKKQDKKRESGEFVRCLQAQIQQEEAENENVNRIRSQQMDRIAKKKDDRLAAEAMERQRQREQIKLSREQQILMKTRDAEMNRRKEQGEVEEAKAAVKRAEEADRRDQEKARAARLETAIANKEMAKEQHEHERLQKEKMQQEERARLQTLERSYSVKSNHGIDQ